MRYLDLKRRNVVVLTVLGWLLIAAVWAYLYGKHGLAVAALAPEEDGNYAWSFWLLMFAIFRLPMLAVGLAIALFAEFGLLKAKGMPNSVEKID
jgi:hypothetical protein